jgi:hypothetical protein
MAMTPTGERDRKPVPSQEDNLLELLRKAEGYAYALAHGYDIGGHPDRAYRLVAPASKQSACHSGRSPLDLTESSGALFRL